MEIINNLTLSIPSI